VIDQDVSRVVGRTIVSWRDRAGKSVDLILDNFGFDDWSAIQSWLLRDKRGRMIQAVQDAAGDLPPDQLDRLTDRALSAAGNLAGLTQDEYQEILNRPDGVSRFFWVMFERRYPGQFTVEDVKGMLRSDAIDQAKAMEVMDSLKFAMGMDVAKKKTDPDLPALPIQTTPTPTI